MKREGGMPLTDFTQNQENAIKWGFEKKYQDWLVMRNDPSRKPFGRVSTDDTFSLYYDYRAVIGSNPDALARLETEYNSAPDKREASCVVEKIERMGAVYKQPPYLNRGG